MSTDSVHLKGILKGHSGWVTAISAPSDTNNFIVSSSRDKTVMVWDMEYTSESVGKPRRALRGHNHFVQDVTLSSDGQFALSASWDKTLRLWNLKTGVTHQRFVGHEGDVLSVSFSPGNRQIVSASRDKTIRVWNILGECKEILGNNVDAHSEWVSCVRFSPNQANPIVVSCGWDKMVKVWDTTQAGVKTNHIGHIGYVNTVTVSPDGSLCASGGKDGVLMLWDLNDGKHLYSLEGGDIIHALCFSPNRYWLCAATNSGIKIWDLESKMTVKTLVERAGKDDKDVVPCLSLAWSHDGKFLYGGFADNDIRVYEVSSN